MKKTPRKIIKAPNKIKSYFLAQKKSIILLIIFGTLYNTTMVLRPIYQGKLIDGLIDKISLSDLVKLTLTFIGVVLMIQTFRYFKRYFDREFANQTTVTMRFMLYNNIIHRSEKELNEENMGTLMTKAMSDVDVCVEGMRKSSSEIFDKGVAFITYLVALLNYNVKITLYVCAFIPLSILIAQLLKKVIFKYTKAYRNQLGQVSQLTYDAISNSVLYRIYGREEDNRISYEEQLKDLEKKAVMSNVWENSMQPIYNVLSMCGIIFVIIMMGNEVYKGTFTIGQFSAYISIFSLMSVKSSRIAKLFNTIQKSRVSWNRIKPYLKEYEEIDESINETNEETIIKATNLSIKYKENYIIKNLNFLAKENEIIGITGPIGCGKSTLGKIFLGEKAYEGSLTVNSKQLSDYSEYERSKIIGYLGHDAHLISDTIYNNITLGVDGDISHVLRMVCFDEDLENMDNGIKTLVGNGGIRLSGGQQARIGLARTLYYNKKILILDDPFASVDMKTEKIIINNLRKNYSDKLIILISHRLTAFKHFEKIILINEDKTLELGNHYTLLSKSQLYNKLYYLQQKKEGERYE